MRGAFSSMSILPKPHDSMFRVDEEEEEGGCDVIISCCRRLRDDDVCDGANAMV